MRMSKIKLYNEKVGTVHIDIDDTQSDPFFGKFHQFQLIDSGNNRHTTPILNNNLVLLGVSMSHRSHGYIEVTSSKNTYEDWQDGDIWELWFSLHDSDIIIASSEKKLRNWFKKHVECCKPTKKIIKTNKNNK